MSNDVPSTLGILTQAITEGLQLPKRADSSSGLQTWGGGVPSSVCMAGAHYIPSSWQASKLKSIVIYTKFDIVPNNLIKINVIDFSCGVRVCLEKSKDWKLCDCVFRWRGSQRRRCTCSFQLCCYSRLSSNLFLVCN